MGASGGDDLKDPRRQRNSLSPEWQHFIPIPNDITTSSSLLVNSQFGCVSYHHHPHRRVVFFSFISCCAQKHVENLKWHPSKRNEHSSAGDSRLDTQWWGTRPEKDTPEYSRVWNICRTCCCSWYLFNGRVDGDATWKQRMNERMNVLDTRKCVWIPYLPLLTAFHKRSPNLFNDDDRIRIRRGKITGLEFL